MSDLELNDELLPNEIWYSIMMRIPRNDIIGTCRYPSHKNFNLICNDNIFWKNKIKLEYPNLYKEVLIQDDIESERDLQVEIDIYGYIIYEPDIKYQDNIIDWKIIYVNGYKYENLYLPKYNQSHIGYNLSDILAMIVPKELTSWREHQIDPDIFYIIPIYSMLGYNDDCNFVNLICIPKNYPSLKLVSLLSDITGINHNNLSIRVSGIKRNDFGNIVNIENVLSNYKLKPNEPFDDIVLGADYISSINISLNSSGNVIKNL